MATLALYATIWIALVLFVVAQHGRWQIARDRSAAWVGIADAAGLTLLAMHIAIAMGVVHGWSHAAATASTAVQTEAVYGLRWGGGIYVNYLFVFVWAADAWLSHVHPRRWLTSRAAMWTIRGFYTLVIVNAAVVFARGSMRMPGIVLVAALLLAWRKTRFSAPL